MANKISLKPQGFNITFLFEISRHRRGFSKENITVRPVSQYHLLFSLRWVNFKVCSLVTHLLKVRNHYDTFTNAPCKDISGVYNRVFCVETNAKW